MDAQEKSDTPFLSPMPVFPTLAVAWARMAELASLLGLGMIVAAESVANLSRHARSSDSDDVYRRWGPEGPRAQRKRGAFAGMLGFFAGPTFWLGLAAGGVSALALLAWTKRTNRSWWS